MHQFKEITTGRWNLTRLREILSHIPECISEVTTTGLKLFYNIVSLKKCIRGIKVSVDNKITKLLDSLEIF